MKSRFAVNTIRGLNVATLTVRCDEAAIHGNMAAITFGFQAECDERGLTVASAFNVEVQPSLIGEDAEVMLAAFVLPKHTERKAPRSRRRHRRIA